MNHPVSMSLIGVGGFGLFHRNAIDLLRKEGLVRLTAVAEPNWEQFSQLRAKYQADGVHLYSDYREMIESEPELDAVTIAAPIPFHFEMTDACLRYGLSIYLEKPPTPLLSQLNKLIEVEREPRVHVGFQLIHSGWSQQIKHWITDGRLGTIRGIRATACWPRLDSYYKRAPWAGRLSFRNYPVLDGPATNALSHLVHATMYLSTPHMESFDEPVQVQGELYRARDIESYDTASLCGVMKSGAGFSIAVTHSTKQEARYQLKITGSKGWARVFDDGRCLESNLGNFYYPEETAELINQSHRLFYDFVTGKRHRPPTRLEDTRGYLLATNGLFCSAKTIHTIDRRHIQFDNENGNKGYHVKGLYEATLASVKEGENYSAMPGCLWARPSSSVNAEQIKNYHFSGILPSLCDPSAAVTSSSSANVHPRH